MSAAGLKELVDHQALLKPLSIEQYHDMIRTGILVEGEPYELLDGYMVRKDRSAEGEDPMTVGRHHSSTIRRLIRLGSKLERLGCCIQVQSPIELPPDNEPEPGAAILLGSVDDYNERNPTAQDVPCVIEVSDSSLRRDRVTKQRIYADGGIRQYVIINLPDNVVEVYTEPAIGKGRYRKTVTLSSGSVEFSAGRGKKLSVAIRSLLP